MKTQATGLTNQMQDWKWLRLGHTRVFPRLAEFTQFLTGSARFSFYLFIYLFIYLRHLDKLAQFSIRADLNGGLYKQ